MKRAFLQFLLALLVRAVVWRTKPTIVAVTGSVGKTTTKEAIAHVLRAHFGAGRVVASQGNYNTEIGVPLTILGTRLPEASVIGWCTVFARAFWNVVRGGGPDVLVLEYAADRPGDIDRLVRIAQPTIGVVTAVGFIPVHVEFYETPLEVAAEKSRLVEALPSAGVAVLNADEEVVWEMRSRTIAAVVGVGAGENASVRGLEVSFHVENIFQHENPSATLKVGVDGSMVPLRLYHVVGRGQVRAALTALAVARAMNVPLLEGVEALAHWMPPAGRMRPLQGIRRSVVLDDAYNASPLSVTMALETLGAFEGHRKIAVLGEMRELGRYAEEAHRGVGQNAARYADRLIIVGPHAPFVREGALQKGMPEGAISTHATSAEAADAVAAALQEGDVVLVKGSRAMRMEAAVERLTDARIAH